MFAAEITRTFPGGSSAKGSMFPTGHQVPWASASPLGGSESSPRHGPGQSSWKTCLALALPSPLPPWWRGAPRATGCSPGNSVLCLPPRSPSKENLLHSGPFFLFRPERRTYFNQLAWAPSEKPSWID